MYKASASPDRNEKGQFYAGMKGAHTTHGLRKTRFYGIWVNMKDRCNNPKNIKYPRYGGRGITYSWHTFESFRDDMYESYLNHSETHGTKDTSLDRRNNDGNYCKENCRWATQKEQARNTIQNKPITFNGKTQTLGAWADEMGLPYSTLNTRKRKGWSLEKMLTTKKYERNNKS